MKKSISQNLYPQNWLSALTLKIALYVQSSHGQTKHTEVDVDVSSRTIPNGLLFQQALLSKASQFAIV